MIGDVLRVVRVCKGNKCFVKAPSTFASFVAFVLFYGINRSKAVDFFEPLKGDLSWVEGALMDARKCLDGDMPDAGKECQYCAFVRVRADG